MDSALALEDLTDRLTWVRTQLALRVPPQSDEVATEQLRNLAAASLRIEQRPSGATPTSILESRLQLSKTELMLVLVLAAVELDSEARRLVNAVAGTFDLPTAPLDVLKRIVYGAAASADALRELGSNGKLRRFGLLVAVEATGGTAKMQWRVSGRVLEFLHGATDCQLPGCTIPKGKDTGRNHLAVSSSAMSTLRIAMRGEAAVVMATGLTGSGRRTLLSTIASEYTRPVMAVQGRWPTDIGAFRAYMQGLALECKLHGCLPLLANIDALIDEKGERIDILVNEFAPLIDGLILATCGPQRPAIKWDRPTIVIEMGRPSTEQLATLWHQKLGQGTEEDGRVLAEQYPLAPALIHHAAEAAKARAVGRALEPEDIYAGIRTVLDDRLGQFARRVTVTQTWDDLVLPQDQVDAIVELMARVRGRSKVYEQWGFAQKVGKGLGVSALFSGPPGTGKTMVAALIARDLGLELYQVDMAKIVSKFIGETEKNLGALFDAAEAGHAILLFDEADALFGKRTDVKSSNDRYANLETNYLLQRLETFTGICLLTSNHESHIDPAFQRRLSLHLRFDVPDEGERAQLWRAVLPPAAPVATDIDFKALARRYAMSGGYIRNAALRAAFLAADEGSAITAAHLERAARVEYEGMGKIAA